MVSLSSPFAPSRPAQAARCALNSTSLLIMWNPLVAAVLLVLFTDPCRADSTTSTSSTTAVYTRYADSGCASTPKQIAFSVSAATCTESTTCSLVGTSSYSFYMKQSCLSSSSSSSSSADMVATAKSLFATTSSSPYVLMEVYSANSSCNSNSLVSGIAFLADGKCLVTDNGDSSVKATVNTDGSALIVTYSGATCSGTATKSNAIASDSVASKTCVNGLFKFYTSDVTTASISTESGGTTTSAAAPGTHAPASSSTSTLGATTVVASIVLAAWSAM